MPFSAHSITTLAFRWSELDGYNFNSPRMVFPLLEIFRSASQIILEGNAESHTVSHRCSGTTMTLLCETGVAGSTVRIGHYYARLELPEESTFFVTMFRSQCPLL
jgi:hypothetical protein